MPTYKNTTLAPVKQSLTPYIIKHFLFISALFLVSFRAQSQESPIIRPFEASCPGVCNGSIEILDYSISPARTYYWRDATEASYQLLESNVLTDLCEGKYWIRQVDVAYQEVKNIGVLFFEKDEFVLMGEYSFSSQGKNELTVYFNLSEDVEYLSYNTKAEYSLDRGLTWKTSSQLNENLRTDLAGNTSKEYLLRLPKSASDQSSVHIRLFRRKRMMNSGKGKSRITINSAHLESKLSTEVQVQLNAQEPMNIRSTVSNEADGGDGYISLDVSGGQAPYVYAWGDGPTAKERDQLSAGDYTVSVEDAKGCLQSVDFNLLPPSGVELSQDFVIGPTAAVGIYALEIMGLYRQPLDLIILDSTQGEVKRFKINPLYDDLHMELDLSFLKIGSYTATLSTSGFSKNSSFIIP